MRLYLLFVAFLYSFLLPAQPLSEEQTSYVRTLLDSAEANKLRNPDASLQFALQALDWLPETGYEKLRAFALLKAANAEKIKGHIDQALLYVNQAYDATRRLQDQEVLQRVYFMKATIFGFNDNLDSSTVYYQKTIDTYRDTFDVFYTANAYTSLGGIFLRLGNIEKAESYFLKGYEIARTSQYAWIFALSRLISFYADRHDPKYLQYLDTFSVSEFARQSSAATVNTHFFAFFDLQNATPAEKEIKLKEIYSLALQKSSPTHQIELGLKLAQILGEQHKYAEANELLRTLLSKAIATRNGVLEAGVNEMLYQNARADGNPKQALQYLERFSFISDSLHTRDKESQIQELSVRFEVAQKDHAIAQQEWALQRARRNRQLLSVIIGSLIVIAGGIYLFYQHRFRTARQLSAKEEIIHQQERERLVQERELVRLSASLESQERERTRIARDLHDGVGSLMSGISAQIESLLSRQPDHPAYQTLKTMVRDTAGELRRTSYELMPANLLRMGLEPALRDLCFNLLTKNKMEARLEFEADLSHLTDDQQLTLYRIVQELLHNIVKHAGATEVLLQIHLYDEELTLIVEDNGKGFDMTPSAMKGIGLGSIQSRVELLNGFLDIASTMGEGTTVTINMTITGRDSG